MCLDFLFVQNFGDFNCIKFASTSLPVNIVAGSHVWVEDPEVVWIDGEVVEVNGEEIKINCSWGKTVVANAHKVYPKDIEAPPCGVDDMTKLAYLHEPGVLQNLRCRYDMNEIYTYTGSILIAVNPFQRLPHLYDRHMMEQYKGASLGDLSPHPFAIADAAYRQMISEGISQSILFYPCFLFGWQSNPVLEAFGNAKTVRNNNSSRFGKFVEIQFDQSGKISGAAIRTYLLERSRVCQVSDPERNYHCFYMLCAAPKEDIERYKLGNPRMFHYLNQSKCYELDGLDDSIEYLATRRAMDIVGISSEEQDAIFRVVAATLHLGNIEFVKGIDTDSSEPEDDKSRFHLRTASELLMCDEKSLEDSLCKRVIVTRDETITKCLDPNAAAVSRDALAKILYSRLFDWLVNKINNSIGQDRDSKFLIGVLDIYGFESFTTNSFEQFCINLTNEKLQQHFNQHVFKMEQEEYTKEEIDWSYIEFIDNRDILDLLEKGLVDWFVIGSEIVQVSHISFDDDSPGLPSEYNLVLLIGTTSRDLSVASIVTSFSLIISLNSNLVGILGQNIIGGVIQSRCKSPSRVGMERHLHGPLDASLQAMYRQVARWWIRVVNHKYGVDFWGWTFKVVRDSRGLSLWTSEVGGSYLTSSLHGREWKKRELIVGGIGYFRRLRPLCIKPGGVIALLDEACMFPRSTHETFAEKLYQTFKDHKRFSKPKLSRTDFTICHYAGDVTYQTEFFLDKNKDYVVAEHQALLSASTCSFVSGLFPPLPEESSKSSKFSSIGSRFKQQLQLLLETLGTTEPHYIRCVKPNNLLKPSVFENSNVLQQLRCGGVMEAIRISCAGFPTRRTFDEFISRFRIIAPDVLDGR
ncbi:hypothetical protein C3L33_22213, partial [Rhododendron williamsianum]